MIYNIYFYTVETRSSGFFNPDFALTRLFGCARRFPSQIAHFNQDSPTSNPNFPKFRPEAQNFSEKVGFRRFRHCKCVFWDIRGRDGIRLWVRCGVHVDKKITGPLSKMMISRFRQRVQGTLDSFLR
jgi:hypothetical protein